MNSSDDRCLLTTRQMAEFVRDGLLTMPGVIDADLNSAALAEMQSRRDGTSTLPRPSTGTPLSLCHPTPSALGRVLRQPNVAGAIHSLLGPDPRFDHDFTHHLPAGWESEQQLHVDAKQDSAGLAFDVQIFYFPHAVGPDEGGTRFVPGTHLRRVHAGLIGRYQNMLGEFSHHGPAGTVILAHQGLWHAGQPNPSPSQRWMHKFRFNPATPQTRHWDQSDFEAIHNRPDDHSFATSQPDTAATMFRHRHEWMTLSTSRIETVQRARLWRYLTNDQSYDVDHYLSRIDNRLALEAEK